MTSAAPLPDRARVVIIGGGVIGTSVAAGSNQFKLQFMMFVPTAQLFASMRNAMAAQKLAQQFNVAPGDNGLERFITATRRRVTQAVQLPAEASGVNNGSRSGHGRSSRA